MTNTHKTILGQQGASDTRKGTEGGSWGVARRRGRSAGSVQGGTKDAQAQVLEGGSRGLWGARREVSAAVFQVCVGP